jgi:hypothetical protein
MAMSAAHDGNASLGQLVATATTELTELVHDEIALGKAELRLSFKKAVYGSSAASVAAVLVLFSLPVLSFALAYGFRSWTGLGLAWCFLIVGGIYWLAAGVFAAFGMSKYRGVKAPTQSIEAAKETAAVLGHVKPHSRAASNGGRPARDVTRSSA